MNITEPTVKSDVNACISQAIAGEELYRSSWLYTRYTNLEIRESTDWIDFPEYQYFCSEGVNVKKYCEYPWRESFHAEELYGYIAENLELGYYVAQYLEEFEYEGMPCKSVVLYYDYVPEKKIVRTLYWSREDSMISASIGFERWYSEVLLADARGRGKFLFDMLRPVGEGKMADADDLMKSFRSEPLTASRVLFWLRRADPMGKRHAARVLRDWFLWMQQCISYYVESGMVVRQCEHLIPKCGVYVQMLSGEVDDTVLRRAVGNYRKMRRSIFRSLVKQIESNG